MSTDPGDISPGESTTLTLDVSGHTSVEIDKIWTDWTVSSLSPAGGTADISAGETPSTGTVTIDWETVQDTSQPSVTLDLPDRYVDGTYRLDITATDGTDTVNATATLSITDDGSASSFQQQVKLTAEDGESGDFFGEAASFSDDGSTALIGAYVDEGPDGTTTGSAYIFSQLNGSWQQQAKLTPDDGDSNSSFGDAVSLSDDGSTAIIGALGDDTPSGEDAGSVYVFSQSNSKWQQQTKLTADDGDINNFFGGAVSLSGDSSTALIGATGDDDPNGRRAGSAYVFSQSNGSWQQQAKLTAEDGEPGDFFGGAVSLSADGSTAVIGAPEEDDPDGRFARIAGSAYVFSQSDGGWQQQTKLAADDGDSNDMFGRAVSLSDDGSTTIIGAVGDEDPNGRRAGSAYVFSQSNGSWQQQAKLTTEDGESGDFFGGAVSLSADGSTAVIGVNNDLNPNGGDAGSAYVFSQSTGDWQQQAKLIAEDGDFDDSFGKAVSLSDDGSTAVIGAFRDEDPNGDLAGSAYVFA